MLKNRVAFGTFHDFELVLILVLVFFVLFIVLVAHMTIYIMY